MENIKKILDKIEKEGFFSIEKTSSFECELITFNKKRNNKNKHKFILTSEELFIFEELKKLLEKDLNGDKEEDELSGKIDDSEGKKEEIADKIESVERLYLQTKSSSQEELKKLEEEMIVLEKEYKKELTKISIMKQLLERKISSKSKIKDIEIEELKEKVQILRNTCDRIQNLSKKKEQVQTQTQVQKPTQKM